MGGWSNRIGKYSASQMDYYYEEIKEESTDLKELENQEIDIKLHFGDKEGDKTVKITELHSFKWNKETKLYEMFTEEDNLFNWLWNYLQSKKTKIITAFQIPIHYTGYHPENIPNLYLNSEIGDEKIICNTEKKEYEITSLENLNWILKRGFYYA